MAARLAVLLLLLGCSSSTENRTPGSSSNGGGAGTSNGGSGGLPSEASVGGSAGSIGGSGGVLDAGPDGVAGGGGQKIVFFTSGKFYGDFASGYPNAAERADALCSEAGAKIDGSKTWRAYVSTSNTDAPDRVDQEGEWYLVDGVTLVFPNQAAWKGFPTHAIDQDELGATYDALTWTGSDENSMFLPPFSCTNWSDEIGEGAVGSNKATDENWVYVETSFCHLARAFYCFER